MTTMEDAPSLPQKRPRQKRDNTGNTSYKYISVFCASIVLRIESIRESIATPAPSPGPTSPLPSSATLSQPFSPKTEGPFSTRIIENFLTNRCGTWKHDESPALWTFEGTLTDPTTGKVIADVEGLELIKRLPLVEHFHLNDKNEQLILDNLHVKNILCSQQDASPQWDTAMTVLCRRLFCYRRRNPEQSLISERTQSSPSSSLLTSLRLRPDGPLRHLSPSESMALYDSALTYISRNKGRDMLILSERGGCGDVDIKKQFVLGCAEVTSRQKNSPSSPFEFSILARRRSATDGTLFLPSTKSDTVDSAGDAISPPRSCFFQFGKGDGSDNNMVSRKFGSVRETYSYSFNNNFGQSDDLSMSPDIFARIVNRCGFQRPHSPSKNQCTVLYTRYGEAPPWYAPGRSVTLELRGQRIDIPKAANLCDDKVFFDHSSSTVPSVALWAASKCNFWSGWPALFSHHNHNIDGAELVNQCEHLPPKSDVAVARNAIELFCSEKNLSFDRLNNDYPIPNKKQWTSIPENAFSKAQVILRRLSKSLVA